MKIGLIIKGYKCGEVDMNYIMNRKAIKKSFNRKTECTENVLNLSQGKINMEYIIKKIKTNNKELRDFLFTLGCYEGERITIISVLAENYVITVKDARYSIDEDLAESILI